MDLGNKVHVEALVVLFVDLSSATVFNKSSNGVFHGWLTNNMAKTKSVNACSCKNVGSPRC